MLDRKKILEEAVHKCFKEMYEKAQPMADYDNLLEEYRTGKIGKDERIYDRHYLSYEEFKYILNKYIDAYRIKAQWQDDVEIVERYLTEGGNKDKYIPERIEPNGFKHPGYRSYEKVPPLKEHIRNILDKELNDVAQVKSDLTEEITNKVLELIKTCKEYYKFDREENSFNFTVTLGASPTSNPETVKQWWKENYNVDIEIEERNPLLLWEYDYYGDEMDEIMTEEYGENWKEIWDEKWQKEKDEKQNKR